MAGCYPPAMRETSYYPGHAYLETGARRIGRIRRQTAERNRSMRERWREEGRPDPATLDRAIVDALRSMLLAAPEGQRLSTPIDPSALLLETARYLVERTERSKARGRDVTIFKKEPVAQVLQSRLLEGPKRASWYDGKLRDDE